ncbi:MAG: hypothetical protein GWN00_02185 [Aliifodinibius sp.]|nr:hypothetical protein [Fodinibius sp.]NIY23666.1 hypothetical protein [Fodinibius sp.]
MPLLSLVLFWILPFSEALPIYAAISVASGLIYLAIIRAMKHHSQTGSASMKGHSVKVLKRIDPGVSGLVLLDGEIWNAESEDILKQGDQAKVTEVKGLTLQVERVHQNR